MQIIRTADGDYKTRLLVIINGVPLYATVEAEASVTWSGSVGPLNVSYSPIGGISIGDGKLSISDDNLPGAFYVFNSSSEKIGSVTHDVSFTIAGIQFNRPTSVAIESSYRMEDGLITFKQEASASVDAFVPSTNTTATVKYSVSLTVQTGIPAPPPQPYTFPPSPSPRVELKKWLEYLAPTLTVLAPVAKAFIQSLNDDPSGVPPIEFGYAFG